MHWSVFTLGQLELVAAYVVVAALLLSIGLWTRVRWEIKAAAIVVTTAFFFVSFLSVRHLLGFPSDDPLPDRFEFLSAVINEPDEAIQSPGAIFIWLMELPGKGEVTEEEVYTPGAIDTRVGPFDLPRAYRLPYSREMHRQVVKARTKTLEGVRQIGVSTRRPKKPGEHAPQSKFSFYDRPDPILPPKGEPPPARPGQ